MLASGFCRVLTILCMGVVFPARSVNGVITVRLGQVLRFFPRMLLAGAEEYDRCQGSENGENSALHGLCCSSEYPQMQPRIRSTSAP